MLTKIKEIMYFVQSKPYFVVYVVKNGRRIKRFIQLAASKAKGEDVFLVNNELKAAWWKPENDSIIIDGLKFMCFMDIDNAIPLKIVKTTDIDSGEWFNTTVENVTISEDIEAHKDKPKSGKSLKFVEINFPPTVLHQKIEAHFIKMILAVGHEKNDYIFWILIAGLGIFGIIAYFWLQSRG